MIPAKAKKLSPALREKRHYLVVLVDASEPEKFVKDSIMHYIGIWGFAQAGPQIIEAGKSNGNNYVILSVLTKWQELVKSALALSGKCRVIGISGTIHKAKEKWLSK